MNGGHQKHEIVVLVESQQNGDEDDFDVGDAFDIRPLQSASLRRRLLVGGYFPRACDLIFLWCLGFCPFPTFVGWNAHSLSAILAAGADQSCYC